jgi:hypothetical protein
MAENATFVKDPSAVLDYKFDWATWLGVDAISSYVLAVQSGLVQASASNTITSVTVWLSGGTAGQSYSVACRIVTAAGRTDERTISILVQDR